ncbi:MAG: hypothetical protein ABIU09_00385 [Pyrinomonadaceae bacterium]
MNDQEDNQEKSGLAENITGLGQKILGEIETFGGILTGDPITQAEGEYNVEVGDVRQDLEEELEEDENADTDASDEKR